MERKTLTVHEIAEYLGVHPDTIYTMVRTSQIPHFRIRRRILFNLETIESWIRQQESSVTTA